MNFHGRDYAPTDLRKRMGNLDQLAGIRLVQLDDGNERPTRAAIFHTGSGLEFTVLLDRGCDIPSASFNGMAMGWRSSTGDVAPQYFEPEGIRWLRSYFGGLLTTCGLQNVGAPDPDSALNGNGLHGRIGNAPARNVQVLQEWQGEEYVLSVRGTMRETRLFGENLSMTRTVRTRLGATSFELEDVIRNEGFEPTPFMLLYHCNIGWPAVEDGSQILSPSRHYAPRDADAAAGHEQWHTMDAPTHQYAEKVYFHDMAEDGDGNVTVTMHNERAQFAVYVKYRKSELPRFTQWKMMGEQAYTCGFEPCNCGVQGRKRDEDEGLLWTLAPGQEVITRLEFGVARGAQLESLISASTSSASQQAETYLRFTAAPTQ